MSRYMLIVLIVLIFFWGGQCCDIFGQGLENIKLAQKESLEEFDIGVALSFSLTPQIHDKVFFQGAPGFFSAPKKITTKLSKGLFWDETRYSSGQNEAIEILAFDGEKFVEKNPTIVIRPMEKEFWQGMKSGIAKDWIHLTALGIAMPRGYNELGSSPIFTPLVTWLSRNGSLVNSEFSEVSSVLEFELPGKLFRLLPSQQFTGKLHSQPWNWKLVMDNEKGYAIKELEIRVKGMGMYRTISNSNFKKFGEIWLPSKCSVANFSAYPSEKNKLSSVPMYSQLISLNEVVATPLTIEDLSIGKYVTQKNMITRDYSAKGATPEMPVRHVGPAPLDEVLDQTPSSLSGGNFSMIYRIGLLALGAVLIWRLTIGKARDAN